MEDSVRFDDILARRDDFPGRSVVEYFARTPYRVLSLAPDIAFWAINVAVALGVVVHYWQKLSLVQIVSLVLALGWLLAMWLRALRARSELHIQHAKGALKNVSPGSPLDVAISAVADLTQATQYLSWLVAIVLILLFRSALRGH
jgi:hypothetical protein